MEVTNENLNFIQQVIHEFFHISLITKLDYVGVIYI